MFVRGNENDFRTRLDAQVGGGSKAVPAGHLDIENDKVGRQRLDLLQCLIAVAGLTYDFNPFNITEKGPQAIEGESLVVHQQDAHL